MADSPVDRCSECSGPLEDRWSMDGRSVKACGNCRLRLQELLEAASLESIRQEEGASATLRRFEVILREYRHLDRDMWLQNAVSLDRVDLLLACGDQAAALNEVHSCLERGAYSPQDFTTIMIVYADVLAVSGDTEQGLLQLSSALRVLGDQYLGDKISLLRTYRALCRKHKVDPDQEIVDVARSLAHSYNCVPDPSPDSDSIPRLHRLESFITALTDYVRSRSRRS